ncbi:MAG: beta-ketoacyl-[acyl-carrier-protein] synthase family protein [Alphaproteobacteria bacterium]|nr:beta-ketoacyl-[acyl-carrier-protein] synthase family protein [Alphaproteobacteria bacterium]
MRRVVITGLGVIAPIGLNVADFGKNLFAGTVAVQRVSFDRPPFGSFSFPGCPITGYKPEEHFDPKRLGFYDRFAQFAVIAAREAWTMSGLSMTPTLAPRVATIIGTGAGGQVTLEESYDRLNTSSGRLHPLTIPRLMANAGASQVSMDIGAQGPAFTIASACASATHAIGTAMQMVRSGMVDVAVTGGSEACLTYGTLKGWEALRVMAPDFCRPFSQDRAGMMLGEGGGALVLETLEAAQARGATIYAELIGFGQSADAKDITTPDAGGMSRAVQGALDDANITAAQVDYINAHGTGTRANDVTETKALYQVLGSRAATIPTSSSKSMFGHLLGGAGALETVATVLALREQKAPPTMGYLGTDPECSLDVVPNAARAVPMQIALKNSFAFGGLNAVLALRAF